MTDQPRIVRRKKGRKRTIDREDMIRRYNRGESDAEIAAAVGCSEKSVPSMMFRMMQEQEAENERAKK